MAVISTIWEVCEVTWLDPADTRLAPCRSLAKEAAALAPAPGM